MEEIINIYGHIADESNIVIGMGDYNIIKGLININNDKVKINTIEEIDLINTKEIILKYEERGNFSLKIKDTDEYIGVNLENNKAIAAIKKVKTLFNIEYSIIDKKSRDKLLSGVLYSLKTKIDGREYNVEWEIGDDMLENGELVMFIPINWYENETCENISGVVNLIERLNRPYFKGYTSLKWCQNGSKVLNCEYSTKCGKCMGNCPNYGDICYSSGIEGDFICGKKEPDMLSPPNITLNNENENLNNNISGNGVTFLAIGLIFLIISLLIYGLYIKKRYNRNNLN